MNDLSDYVIDASVAVKWFLNEELAEEALEILHQLSFFYAPEIFLTEIDSVLTKYVRQRKMTISDAWDKRKLFRVLPYRLIEYNKIEDFAFQLATEFSVTTYDASYLAIAIDYNAVLYTADQRLANGLSTTPFSDYVKSIG